MILLQRRYNDIATEKEALIKDKMVMSQGKRDSYREY